MATLQQFFGKCKERGWTRRDTTNGGADAGITYTTIEGPRYTLGHNGSFHVPLEDDNAFIDAVVMLFRAQGGGRGVLSIHQRTDPPHRGEMEAKFPFFMDVDWTCWPEDMSDCAIGELAERVNGIMHDSGLVDCAEWTKHAMSRAPACLTEHFPHLTTPASVFLAFSNNFQENCVVQGCSCTLLHLFRDEPRCQNWITENVAVAFGMICQRQLKRYFCDADTNTSSFDFGVFACRNDDPLPTAKLNMHIHAPKTVVTTSMALSILEGIREHFETAYKLGSIIDSGPAMPGKGLRMPCTPKAEPPRKRRESKRPRFDNNMDDEVAWHNRVYMGAAFLPGNTGMPDLASALGRAFLTDMNTMIQFGRVRVPTPAARITPGFDSRGLPETTWKPALRADVFTAAGLPVAKARKFAKQLASATANADPREQARQVDAYRDVVAGIVAQKTGAHSPAFVPITDDKVLRFMNTFFPSLASVCFNNNREYAAIEVSAMSASLDGTKIWISTDRSMSLPCHNKRGPDGKPPAAHGMPGTVSFRLELDEHRIVQLCRHDGTSNPRVFGMSCKEWKAGQRAHVDTAASRAFPGSSKAENAVKKFVDMFLKIRPLVPNPPPL